MAATAVAVTTVVVTMVEATTVVGITAAGTMAVVITAVVTAAAIMVEIITAAAITAAIIMMDTTARTGAATDIGAATVTAATGMAAGGGAAMASARAGSGLLPGMSGSATKTNKRGAGTGQLPVTIKQRNPGCLAGLLRRFTPRNDEVNATIRVTHFVAHLSVAHHSGSIVNSSCGCKTPRSA